ncbi:MAG: serine O-acetyltransferase [Candidatus Omnitrophica bacterium]|nr:serine O-acetyltransferase [Candidatus Omnitrophota bacterium]
MQYFINFVFIFASLLIIFYFSVRVFFKEEITATFERDPAASSYAEIVFTYSGLHALIFYRISHKFYEMSVPVLPRLLSQLAKFLTGIEIHPGAKIGKKLFIDHGMGVVVGETTIIGDNVTMFQGVTLGGTGKEKGKRHPTLGNNIVVGAGAKVLGNIEIGDNVLIGANAVVLRDVPPDSTVVGVPGRIAKRQGRRIPGGINLDHSSLPDPLQQALENLQLEIDHIEGEIQEHYHDQKDKNTKDGGAK